MDPPNRRRRAPWNNEDLEMTERSFLFPISSSQPSDLPAMPTSLLKLVVVVVAAVVAIVDTTIGFNGFLRCTDPCTKCAAARTDKGEDEGAVENAAVVVVVARTKKNTATLATTTNKDDNGR